MSGGHACSVQFLNEMHEASKIGRPDYVVEAYGFDDISVSACAASHIGGSSAFSRHFNAVLPWTHSINEEADFLSPYSAILTAQLQRFEVLFAADGEAKFSSEWRSIDPSGKKTGNFSQLNHLDHPSYGVDMNPSAMTVLQKKKPNHLIGPNQKRVGFEQVVTIHIGSDFEISMYQTYLTHDTLVNWIDKPWQLWNWNKKGVRVRCAPPSEKAVLSSACSPRTLHLQSLLPQMPIDQCRITDFHGHVEGLDRAISHEENEQPIGDGNEQPIEIPTFLRHLLDLAPFADEMTEEDVLPLHVRTWHIHHEEHPNCKFPRIIELNGEWNRWHREILSGWPDRVGAQEPHRIHVVQPEPHRHPRFQHCIADLIIVTGDEDGRYVGLTTVSPLIPNDGPIYSIAASFPAEVSGIMIRNAAEADHTCERRRCNIYHGWNEIPQTFDRVHRMSQGDSLVVYLTRSGAHSGASVPEALEDHDMEVQQETEDVANSQDVESGENMDVSDSPSVNYHTRAYPEALQTAKLYRLNHPTVQARVRWRHFDNLLLDVARSLGIPVAQITSLHHVRVVPVGENDNEASIIVQMVNDIPDGSSDKLILLDIEMHHDTAIDQYPRTPTVSRQVKKVVLHMARPHVLMLGDLYKLCRDLGDRCLVHHDHLLWSLHDLAVRTFGHGHYLRITVPNVRDSPAVANHAPHVDIDEGSGQALDGEVDLPDEQGYSPSAGHANRSVNCDDPEEPLDDVHDDVHFMQQVDRNNTDSSSQDDIPQDWSLNLRSLVRPMIEQCHDRRQDEFLFSVYTWYVDHISDQLCREPKIVTLGSDPREWEEDILRPWSFRLISGEAVFIDLVRPQSPRADIEEHIAHLIITQRPTTLSSVLLALEFTADHERSVIVRFALAAPKSCGLDDLASVAPFFARFLDRQMQWDHPVGQLTDQKFQTWNGMCIKVRILPEETDETQDMTSFIQSDVNPLHDNQNCADHDLHQIHFKPSPTNDVIDIPMMLPPHVPMRRLRPRHDGDFQWFDDLAGQFETDGIHEHLNGVVFLHIMTWFIHHRRYQSCVSPRPVRLEGQAITWIEDLKHAWRDLLDDSEVLSIHMIQPRPNELRGRQVACHVLLEQARPVNRCAGLLTGVMEEQRTHSWMQGAFSVPNPISFQYAARTLGIWAYCQEQTCTFKMGTRDLSLTMPEPLQSGFNLQLRVLRSAAAAMADVTQQFDAMSFMQRSVLDQATQTYMQGDATAQVCQSPGLDVNALVFHPDNPPIESQNEFTQDLYACWSRHTSSWQSQTASVTVITWFVDHREHFPVCIESREVRLNHAFQQWEQLLRGRWRDVIDYRLPLEFHVVLPSPPRLERDVAAHVILIQAPKDDWVSNLVSVEDDVMTALNDGHLMRLVITTHEHILLEHVMQTCGYDVACIWATRPLQCRAWIQNRELLLGHRWPGRSGSSIHVRILRHAPSLRQSTTAMNLLQTGVTRRHVSIPSYQRLLDHAAQQLQLPQRPQADAQVLQTDMMRTMDGKVVRIVSTGGLPLPTFMDVPAKADSHHVLQTVQSWIGPHTTVVWHWLEDIDVLLALNDASQHECWHIFYIDVDAKPFHFTYHDVVVASRSELEHMRWLYRQGHQRAVILQSNTPSALNVQIVRFKDQIPQLPAIPDRTPTPWPQRLPCVDQIQEVYQPGCATAEPIPCSWSIGVEQDTIAEFFTSADNILSRSFEGMALPQHVNDALLQCKPLDRIDRLVIYADGSSLPEHRRRPPEQVELEGHGDTWAFLVLGEQYVDQSVSNINVLGRTAQPVLYNSMASHCIGSSTVGSDTAEREAMFWCGAWRLAQNCNIPTTFCTDSQSAGRQADGTNGSHSNDDSFLHLRAIYQGLEGSLHQGLDIQHVKGHSNDPWNDLVDFLAKSERQSSFYHKRQALDMFTWRDALKHLWTQVTSQVGLPQFNGQVFNVQPPALPIAGDSPDQSVSYQSRSARFCISLATANVNSLHAGPEGYGGKLQFIRDQMKALHLLFLGIQESRSCEVCSQHDDILRLGSGSTAGHHGVELWINMQQPFAYLGKKPQYLRKQNVVVVHADPRSLLVRLSHDVWNAWILVAHGPHSGHTDDLRQTWWSSLSDTLARFVGDGELYALLDANAEPGPTDAIHVGPQGTCSSKSTKLLRDFLQTWALALPGTFSCHQGPQHTWTAPDGLTQHCIDHVCVPCKRLGDCMFSRVVDEFDLGNPNWDHSVVAAELSWANVVSLPRHASKESRANFNRDSIHGSILASPLQQFMVPEWSEDIHSHVSKHNQHLRQCLQQVCPPHRQQAKKSFITADIWAFRDQKLQCRKVGKDIRSRYRAELLRAAWCGWKTCLSAHYQDMTQYAEIFQHYITALYCWRLFHGVQLHVLAGQLRHKLKWARRAAIHHDMQNTTEDMHAGEVLQLLKKHIGPTNLKSLKKPTLPMLREPEGQQCVSPMQLCDVWINFFGQMEGGVRMSWQDLTNKWIDSLADFQQQHVTLGPTDIPCLTDLEVAFRRVRKGKALGQDYIPPELCRACPTVLAKQYYSALMKLVVHGQESLHHKGGTLVPAFKGKGSALDPSSYRSLLISSHMGKVLHRTIRQHQSQMYETFLCAQQFGGRKRVPVTLGLHEARAFLRSKQKQGLSVGLLMVDLTEAFYRVLRPLAVGGQYTDHQIAQLVAKLGMPPETMQELLSHLQEPSAIEQANLPMHLQRVLRSLHTDTYFQVPGQTDCCHTSVGSRPGDCFADVVFSYLFSRVMKCFQNKLAQTDLYETIRQVRTFEPFAHDVSSAAVIPYSGPIWMDDLCVGMSAATPAALIHKAGVTTSLLLETLVGYGMTPNLKKGKTELLVSLRGKGVRKMKQQLFGPNSVGSIPIICEASTQHVSVVGQYQHLGGLLHHGGDHRHEMKRRVAIANTAFNTHRKVIYQNGDISLCKRVQLFNTLIVSKLVYGCESWVLRDMRSKEQLHAAIMKLYKRMLGCKAADPHSDDWVLKELNLPSPTELLRQARLRYLGTLHACSEVVTWDVLNNDAEWCALIRDDLNWMWNQLANSSQLKAPSDNFEAWRYLWTYHRPYWKGLIKRAVQHAVLQRHNAWVVKQGHQCILEQLRDIGHIQMPDEIPPAIQPEGPQCYGCMACGQAFKSKAGEGAHMFRKHGIISDIRYLFDHTRCEVCMKEYFTFSKLHNHLRHSHRCRVSLQNRPYRTTPQEGHGSQVNSRMEHQHDGLLPPLISQGPCQVPIRLRAVEDFDVDLYSECTEQLMIDGSLEDKLHRICAVAGARAIAWTRFQQTLRCMKENVTGPDLEAFGLCLRDFETLIDTLVDSATWPWFQHVRSEYQQDSSLADLEWQCDNATLGSSAGSSEAPRSFGTHRFILHAFSGRRRQGDFQFFLEAITTAHPGIVIHTLSVDIILDSKWGDVSKEHVQNFWLSAAQQGWVVAFLGGPPCETWSRAREQSLRHGSKYGPRVLRSAQTPWGFASLALREVRQILVGNQLMLFCLRMMTVLYVMGGCGALEHPARPPKATSASIWNTPILNLLLQLPGFSLWEFAQGLLGAVSAKPTMILSLNLPTLGVAIHQWRVVDELPKMASIGQGTDGKFKTMILKEYPPAMCAALASAFWQAMCQRPILANVQIPSDFFAICASMDVKVYSDAIGPDYAGG